MNEIDDDNAHYDDLIRELRALKRFIEDNGDKDEDDAASEVDTRENDRSSGAAKPRAAPVRPKTDEPPLVPPPLPGSAARALGEDDGLEPPTLREAVRRPSRRDEMQLDLLSIGDAADDEDDAQDMEEVVDTDNTEVDASTTRETEDTTLPAATVPVSTAAEGTNAALDDDTVLTFVLDLSDRILDTIEDKLIEVSGERLPSDLRDELRDSIGDILYQWCER